MCYLHVYVFHMVSTAKSLVYVIFYCCEHLLDTLLFCLGYRICVKFFSLNRKNRF